MRKSYIAGNYPDRFTAAGKAKIDAEDIVRELGYSNCGGFRGGFKDGSLKVKLRYLYSYLKTWCSLKKNTILFFQYPSTKALRFEKLAKNRGCKIITLVHDLNTLRGHIVKTEAECLRLSDVIIAHTPAMKRWLIERDYSPEKIVVLEIFDYLKSNLAPVKENHSKIHIGFAGNLGKSDFLDQLKLNHVSLDLFGIGIEKRTLGKGVAYKGCFPPEQLSKYLDIDYGLVWDGDSIESCEGDMGKYLRLISPHKLSMYISSGIPVIVWKGSAMAEFVLTNGIGIAIDSLTELDSLLPAIPKEDYESMRSNSLSVASKLSSGYYLKKALKNAEGLIDGQ